VLTKPGTGSSSSAEAAYRGENEKIDVECSILFRAGLLCAAACQDLFFFFHAKLMHMWPLLLLAKYSYNYARIFLIKFRYSLISLLASA